MFDNLTDIRNQSYVIYNMKTICVTRLFGLLCGLTTMTDITNKFASEIVIKNISNICKISPNELPYWETIQDVFVNLDLNELRNIQKYIVKALLHSKMFDKYRYNGHFQLIFDGTGLSTHNYNYLSKRSKGGKIIYYKYVLECKLVVALGRKRWKIENVGFCNQRHRAFDITYLNSRNDNAMKCHYFFIQIAHTIRQLLEKGNSLTKSLNLKI